MLDIKNLHNSTCAGSYQLDLKMILNKWKKDPTLKDFHDYFNKQLVKSVFNRWQIYLTPSGFANTNSPIESFNNSIKEHFTKRLKYHIISALEVFVDLVHYESDNKKQFELQGKVYKHMIEDANHLLKKGKLELN
ncbi:unnamed protein product [Brachionus calyciflorus]|uniref:Transposase n=1 Tax=Brachionus calyciflorus TaxID=104777 RepID=A0A814IH16_9BILA|nr:unnamed protein product [Brachionus calyciflorus]